MTDSKYTMKDLRVLASVDFIKNILGQLELIKENLSTLGIGYLSGKDKEGKFIKRDVQELQAVINTAGNPIANDLLIKKVNKLEYEVAERFKYIPLIEKCLKEVWDAFRIAVGKHFQVYERGKLEVILKSLGSASVIQEPDLGLLPDKSKRKKKVSED